MPLLDQKHCHNISVFLFNLIVCILVIKIKEQLNELNRINIKRRETLKSLTLLFQNSPYALEIAKNPVKNTAKSLLKTSAQSEVKQNIKKQTFEHNLYLVLYRKFIISIHCTIFDEWN